MGVELGGIEPPPDRDAIRRPMPLWGYGPSMTVGDRAWLSGVRVSRGARTARLALLPLLIGLGVPTSSGAADQELIADGGFEAGTSGGIWSEFSTNFGTTICSVADCGIGGGTGPRTGAYWTWLGGTTASETAYVNQTVTIREGAATLSFWLEIPACGTGGAAETFSARVDANTVFSTTNADAACGATGYVKKTVDVSAFANGTQHTLEFRAVLNAGQATDTNFMVDDVSLLALNRTPVLGPVGDRSIDEGQSLSFQISAADPDGEDSLTFSASNLPAGASFNPATRQFSWTPGFSDAGSYPNVHFEVADATDTDAEDITMTVNEAGPEPTTTSLAIEQTKRKVIASGEVQPAQIGNEMKVTLSRKTEGRFRRLATKRPVLDAESEYSTAFGRPDGGRCRVKSKFTGGTESMPSSASETFRC
jgi:hypothetical protein